MPVLRCGIGSGSVGLHGSTRLSNQIWGRDGDEFDLALCGITGTAVLVLGLHNCGNVLRGVNQSLLELAKAS